jgi:hypothetical protein
MQAGVRPRRAPSSTLPQAGEEERRRPYATSQDLSYGFFLIEKVQMMRFSGENWELF